MSLRQKQEARKKDFKKGISTDESRRKREESQFELRKSKREESQQKRRNIPTSVEDASIPVTSKVSIDFSLMPQNVAALSSESSEAVLQAATYFRKILSIEQNPPIEAVISTGIVPRLVQLLGVSGQPHIQMEAAWALTNIASGTSEQTLVVVSMGAVPVFISLLQASDADLQEQAVWALGNIAGDSPHCRDYCLDQGMMPGILNVVNHGGKPSMLRNATWSISNLCRGKPQPQFARVAAALPTLAHLLQSNDTEIVVDACWALSYLSDGPNEHIQHVIDAGVVPKVLEHLSHTSATVQTPALRTIGNIVTGNDAQTQLVVNLGALNSLGRLLSSTRKALRKEAAWTISNITAGNVSQCQHVIDAGLLVPLVNLFATADFDVKKECAWALSNASIWKKPEQIQQIAAAGAIKPMCDLLALKDVKVILVVIEFLENVLHAGHTIVMRTAPNKPNPFVAMVEEADGLDKLEVLQEHENEDVYQRSVRLLETYFGAEEIDENAHPNLHNTATASAYNFGFGAQPAPAATNLNQPAAASSAVNTNPSGFVF